MQHAVHTELAPLRLPGSAFWNIFKRFGRDEMTALAFSVIGTLIISYFTSWVLLLALAGPVIEKLGFFPTHVWEARQLYRATPVTERGTLWSYIRSALKGGTVSLIEDVVVHDPIYLLLFWWLTSYPGVPIWLIAGSAFFIAVAVVAGLELAYTEVKYTYLGLRLRRAGFRTDQYREARFFIRTGQHADAIIAKLQEGLAMQSVETLQYEDRYFLTDSPKFSGRSPILRLRKRTAGKNGESYSQLEGAPTRGFRQSLQLVYTLPQEEQSRALEQFRFFSVRKDKFYYPLDAEMPATPEEIPSGAIQKLVRAGREYKHLQFERTILLDPTKLLYAGVDRRKDGEDGCVVELKIRKDLPLLLAAMRFVMREFPVTHTTMQKTEIALF